MFYFFLGTQTMQIIIGTLIQKNKKAKFIKALALLETALGKRIKCKKQKN